MNSRFLRLIQGAVLLLDLVALNLGTIVLFSFTKTHIPQSYYSQYVQYWLVLNGAWLCISWFAGVYMERYLGGFETFSRRTMHAYIFWLCTVTVYLFFYRQTDISRYFVFATLGGFGAGLLINRFIYLITRHYFRNRDDLAKKVLIIGYNETSKKLVDYLEEENVKTEIIGFCETPGKVRELSHYPIVSSIENVINISRQYHVNEIYSTIAPEQNHQIYKYMQIADQECIRFRIIPDLSYFIKKPVHINYLKDLPVLSLRSEPLDDMTSRFKKRWFDIIASTLVFLTILWWLLPLISLLVWLDSRGPIFFVQMRTGKDNKAFPCLKFRSMKMNKDADRKQATRNDVRLTRMGNFLRRTNLDEFPQFINVLRGEMSIVGPRPHMLKHTEDYSKLIGQYMIRQFMKPGITGWAQVNGLRGETRTVEQMQSRVEHDIWYMENWSLWLDVRIIFLTVINTLVGDKNAF